MGSRKLFAWRSPDFADSQPVVHGVFARLGGNSSPPFDSLNFGLHTEDDAATVIWNRAVALASMGLDPGSVVAAEQVHGAEVAEVGRMDHGRGARAYDTAVPGVDALITRELGVVLLACFADCLPVFVRDVGVGWIGLAHAGWRGTVMGVTSRTLGALIKRGALPSDLVVALGPCIGPCCYEVGTDVARAFKDRFGQGVIARSRTGRTSVDLVLANRMAALEAGVPSERIFAANICTSCRTDLFFSHRAEGGRTGRMGAVIAVS